MAYFASKRDKLTPDMVIAQVEGWFKAVPIAGGRWRWWIGRPPWYPQPTWELDLDPTGDLATAPQEFWQTGSRKRMIEDFAAQTRQLRRSKALEEAWLRKRRLKP